MHDEATPYFVWEERFVLGIPAIDHAHEEMFKVINRVHRMIRIGGNVKWTVAEAIKFFRAYAIRHFEEEEAFMQAVNYIRFNEHKLVHDGMRDRILPRMHTQLEKSGYSSESVEQFMRICEKWLTKHIIGQDRDLVNWTEQNPETAG